MEDLVKVGQYVVIQRKDFTKLHKITERDSTVQMGRDIVCLKNVIGQELFKTYKMQLSSVGKKRSYNLQPCENVTDWKEVLNSIDSGADNRNINDDGQVNRTETMLEFRLTLTPRFYDHFSHKHYRTKRFLV